MATQDRLTAQQGHNRRYRERLRERGRPTRTAVAKALLDRALASRYPEAVLQAAHGLCARGHDEDEVRCLLEQMVAQAKAARANVDTNERDVRTVPTTSVEVLP